MKNPVFRFESDTDTGINKIPVPSVVVVSNTSTVPKMFTLISTSGLTDSSTLADLEVGTNFEMISNDKNTIVPVDDTTSTPTANPGGLYMVDTTNGPVTINLPASPQNLDTISFVDAKGTFDQNNLTVGRNGNNIMGLAEDMIVGKKYIAFDLIYYNGDWRLG